MRPDRMTTKSQEAFRDALDLASRRGNPELVPEHLLLGMLSQEGGVARPLLQKAGADPARLEQAVTAHLDKLPRVSGGAEPGLSRRVLELLRKAEDEAKALKDDFVSVEHFVLSMAKHDRELAAMFDYKWGGQAQDRAGNTRSLESRSRRYGRSVRTTITGAIAALVILGASVSVAEGREVCGAANLLTVPFLSQPATIDGSLSEPVPTTQRSSFW